MSSRFTALSVTDCIISSLVALVLFTSPSTVQYSSPILPQGRFQDFLIIAEKTLKSLHMYSFDFKILKRSLTGLRLMDLGSVLILAPAHCMEFNHQLPGFLNFKDSKDESFSDAQNAMILHLAKARFFLRSPVEQGQEKKSTLFCCR